MQIEFAESYLSELYTEGKCKSSKHRFQPQVVKQYIKTVKVLESAKNIEALYKFKSLHYEKKEGNLSDKEAVWVNEQFRLEFKSREEGVEPDVIVICSLEALSNHYKK